MAEIEAIIPKEATVELADGKKYTVRRLSLGDVFALAKLGLDIYESIGPEQIKATEDDSQLILLVITEVLKQGGGQFYKLLGGIIGIDPAQAERLPLEDVIKVINAIVEQEDFDRLFLQAKTLTAAIQKKWNLASASSTS